MPPLKRDPAKEGYNLVDSVSALGYQLYLYHHDDMQFYQIAIAKTDMDFSDIDQQYQKQHSSELPDPATIDFLQSTIRRWLQQYKKIYIASHNDTKTNKYEHILQWLGFNVERENFGGFNPIVLKASSNWFMKVCAQMCNVRRFIKAS